MIVLPFAADTDVSSQGHVGVRICICQQHQCVQPDSTADTLLPADTPWQGSIAMPASPLRQGHL